MNLFAAYKNQIGHNPQGLFRAGGKLGAYKPPFIAIMHKNLSYSAVYAHV
mgnify:CR=1 FL=1